jgi:hypothetical protein
MIAADRIICSRAVSLSLATLLHQFRNSALRPLGDAGLGTFGSWGRAADDYWIYNKRGPADWLEPAQFDRHLTSYSYDAADRLTQVANNQPQNMILASFDYPSAGSWTPPRGMTEAVDWNSKGFSSLLPSLSK